MRSTRTSPRPLGACTNSSPPIAIPTCDAPRPSVLKNTRSPASTAVPPTSVPSRNSSPTVRGTRMPCCPRTYQTNPLQSKPDGIRSAVAVRRSPQRQGRAGDRVPVGGSRRGSRRGGGRGRPRRRRPSRNREGAGDRAGRCASGNHDREGEHCEGSEPGHGLLRVIGSGSSACWLTRSGVGKIRAERAKPLETILLRAHVT